MKNFLIALTAIAFVTLSFGCYPHLKYNLNYSAKVLENGYMLVRLQDGQKTAQALREAGYAERAEKSIAKQQAKNEKIMTAFAERYSLSPVYFFYAKNQAAVLDGTYEAGMVFDINNQPVDFDQIQGRSFMVAEIDRGYSDWLPGKDKEGNVSGVAGTNSFDALIMYDKNMKPYFQRACHDDYKLSMSKFNRLLSRYPKGPSALYELNN
jgi:hypothetical protein